MSSKAVKLFNPKTIQRHTRLSAIPPHHLEILSNWRNLIESGRINTLKETALHGDFSAKIIEGVLGYKGPVDHENYTVSTEQKILRGSVDLALGYFGDNINQIIAPLELKGARTANLDAMMPGRNKSPVQQAWEYATGIAGVKWVLVSNYIELRLYAFGGGIEHYETFELARLTELAEYARFMLLLSAENLLTDKTLNLLAESQSEDQDITVALYKDYKDLRIRLINTIQGVQPDIDRLRSIAMAQTILDRIIFIAFAEDNGLLPRDILARAYRQQNDFAPEPVWKNFQGLFRAIDKGNANLKVSAYNGGLFAPDPELDALLLPDDLCEAFKSIGAYDFASEVSVTVLGHIFEQSIADVERLQAIARGEEPEEERTTGTSGRRKRDGVVYTPDYIARFIVTETLGKHLQEIFDQLIPQFVTQKSLNLPYEKLSWKNKKSERQLWETYRDALKRLRILDPACGSGVFLIMAFDFLKAEMLRVNEKIAELTNEQFGLFDPDSEILTNNLFGVDVNEESVEIAKLSLWIKTARPGKALDSLDGSLQVGDSIISDNNYAYLQRGFQWEEAFPQVFADGGFDVILGNPPYVRMEFLKAMKPALEKHYEVASDRADLYAYFFERGLKLLKPGGRLGFISSSTFFKTGAGKPLREFLLRNTTLETILNFGDLQVFEGVTTYPAILTMRRKTPPQDHNIRFWNLETLPDQNFGVTFEQKVAHYPQSALTSGSWELENPALQALRTKIRDGRPTLKDIYGSPLYGIKTGLNEAFVIDNATKEKICAQDPKSAELLKPFLEGRDLKRWRAEPRGLWIIYIPKNRIDIDDYPGIRDWLLPFRERLENRATKQEWFELQQAQEAYSEPLSKPKISFPHFNADLNFSQELTGAFSNDKSYAIPTSDNFLLGILNSSITWYFLSSIAPSVRGGYREFRVQYVEQLPIPAATTEQKEKLSTLAMNCQNAAAERLKLQEAFRRRLPDLCPPERTPKLTNKLIAWWEFADFAALRAEIKKTFKTDIPLAERNDWHDWFDRDRHTIAQLTAQITTWERDINTIVYGLFELTAEEIQLLEESI